MAHSQKFSLYYGKDAHEIDAQTLADSLSSFSTLLAEINKDLHTGKNVEFKVKSFRPGSFEVPCELIELIIAGVLSTPQANSLPDILKTAWELIKLKLDLGGKPPKQVTASDNATAIVTESGNVTYVDKRTFNIFQNNVVATDALEKQFSTLARDKEVKEFKVLMDDSSPLVEVPAEKFPLLADTISESEKDTKSRIESCRLNLLKVVFDNRYKWEFYKQGVKIAAAIRDLDFLTRVAGGEKFAKGDIIVAEVQTHQVFDRALNTYINRSYEILTVHEHIPRAEQIGMNF